MLIEGTYFAQVLGHPAGPAPYLKLVWLATSVGIVAGAVGSSLEDEERVRRRPTAAASGSGSSATANAPRKPKAAVTTERSPGSSSSVPEASTV
ncbi:hypothetical protein [Amycolatopsis balhimycina]|uniref:hypothetical protein n=1 Tax=Amycolatopsis balhimycina TaxID=208443 RepID=UPI001FDEB52B|nr:hypothetical protein [Amycolatopsis balhimycina]